MLGIWHFSAFLNWSCTTDELLANLLITLQCRLGRLEHSFFACSVWLSYRYDVFCCLYHTCIMQNCIRGISEDIHMKDRYGSLRVTVKLDLPYLLLVLQSTFINPALWSVQLPVQAGVSESHLAGPYAGAWVSVWLILLRPGGGHWGLVLHVLWQNWRDIHLIFFLRMRENEDIFLAGYENVYVQKKRRIVF